LKDALTAELTIAKRNRYLCAIAIPLRRTFFLAGLENIYEVGVCAKVYRKFSRREMIVAK
jgi:hypothetical protein